MLVAFVKSPEKGASLVPQIQKLEKAHGGKLKTFVVFNAGPEAAPAVTKLAQEKGINIPLTVLAGGPNASDVKSWKINPDAENTILLYRQRNVKANFVNVTDKTFGEVEKAVEEMLK